jgi:BirA family biotin operon repressor/biotin-[acetyl-CoA-carboxylase] ligase
MLSEKRIYEELNKLGIDPPRIILYDETDSTNTRAKEYAESVRDKETVIFIANSQTAGRGRLGRSFVSNKGAGIYMSILSYPSGGGFDSTKVTTEWAVKLCRAIERVCSCKISIKWVNDLYLGGKKLAGILTEGKIENDGKIAYQIVGMGINVYKNAISSEISSIATSLESETNIPPDRSTLVAEIIGELFSDTDCYEEYRARSIVIGREVTVVKLQESYRARVIDLNPDYSLKIERDGRQESLFTGEISIKTDSI